MWCDVWSSRTVTYQYGSSPLDRCNVSIHFLLNKSFVKFSKGPIKMQTTMYIHGVSMCVRYCYLVRDSSTWSDHCHCLNVGSLKGLQPYRTCKPSAIRHPWWFLDSLTWHWTVPWPQKNTWCETCRNVCVAGHKGVSWCWAYEQATPTSKMTSALMCSGVQLQHQSGFCVLVCAWCKMWVNHLSCHSQSAVHLRRQGVSQQSCVTSVVTMSMEHWKADQRVHYLLIWIKLRRSHSRRLTVRAGEGSCCDMRSAAVVAPAAAKHLDRCWSSIVHSPGWCKSV